MKQARSLENMLHEQIFETQQQEHMSYFLREPMNKNSTQPYNVDTNASGERIGKKSA